MPVVMGKPKKRDEPPGWYWPARIVLDAVKTGAVIAIRWAWEHGPFKSS